MRSKKGPRPRKKDERPSPPVVPAEESPELITIPSRSDDTSSASLGEQVENRRSDQDPAGHLTDEG
jgi:hypothetical protein